MVLDQGKVEISYRQLQLIWKICILSEPVCIVRTIISSEEDESNPMNVIACNIKVKDILDSISTNGNFTEETLLQLWIFIIQNPWPKKLRVQHTAHFHQKRHSYCACINWTRSHDMDKNIK